MVVKDKKNGWFRIQLDCQLFFTRNWWWTGASQIDPACVHFSLLKSVYKFDTIREVLVAAHRWDRPGAESPKTMSIGKLSNLVTTMLLVLHKKKHVARIYYQSQVCLPNSDFRVITSPKSPFQCKSSTETTARVRKEQSLL